MKLPTMSTSARTHIPAPKSSTWSHSCCAPSTTASACRWPATLSCGMSTNDIHYQWMGFDRSCFVDFLRVPLQISLVDQAHTWYRIFFSGMRAPWNQRKCVLPCFCWKWRFRTSASVGCQARSLQRLQYCWQDSLWKRSCGLAKWVKKRAIRMYRGKLQLHAQINIAIDSSVDVVIINNVCIVFCGFPQALIYQCSFLMHEHLVHEYEYESILVTCREKYQNPYVLVLYPAYYHHDMTS